MADPVVDSGDNSRVLDFARWIAQDSASDSYALGEQVRHQQFGPTRGRRAEVIIQEQQVRRCRTGRAEVVHNGEIEGARVRNHLCPVPSRYLPQFVIRAIFLMRNDNHFADRRGVPQPIEAAL